MNNTVKLAIDAYKAKKEELKQAMAAELKPLWDVVVTAQMEASKEKAAMKREKSIAYHKEQLAKLEGDI